MVLAGDGEDKLKAAAFSLRPSRKPKRKPVLFHRRLASSMADEDRTKRRRKKGRKSSKPRMATCPFEFGIKGSPERNALAHDIFATEAKVS